MQIIRSVLLYEKENTAFKAQVVTATTKWLKHILFIALGVCVFWGISIFLMFYKSAAPMYYPVWIGISFLIYWVSYVGANESYILSGRAAIREQMAAIRQNEINDASATATIASKAKIINQFEEAIRNLYLNPSLSQNDVAAHLGISSSYLSQVINNSNIKFNDYLNAVRIEKAKRMLSDETFSNYTITAIGLESGFNSNASFYRAFKKHTDLSPKDYRFSSR
ncbi:MAG TPA: AraC family transcriptional regulator [Flavobacterium sp.]|nr:AraC family transcriptional regulator [Flavobacterium sp.]